MNVDRTTIKNSSLGEHHMVWNAKTKLYTDELKYRIQAIWNIYLLDAALPKEFSTVAVQEKTKFLGKTPTMGIQNFYGITYCCVWIFISYFFLL